MAAILASHNCYCHSMELSHHRISVDDLRLSSSMSGKRLPKFGSKICRLRASRKNLGFRVEMRQTKEPAELGINGRAIKLVPTSEVMKDIRKPLGKDTEKVINGSGSPTVLNGSAKKSVINGSARKSVVNGSVTNSVVNGSASKSAINGSVSNSIMNGSAGNLVNGVNIVKREAGSLVKRLRSIEDEGLPPLDEQRNLPTDVGFSWASDNYSTWQRTVDVWSFIISLRVRILLENAKWSYPGGFDVAKQKKRREQTAAWLRERVLELGPCFIKLGQLSSTRSDLFPREYVDELAKLQDRVPAFSPEKAREFIAKELGAPVNILFKVFEDQPIAAASLGQVHRAILHNGEKVVVKVQRPGLKRLFDIDLQNLKLIAEYFQNSETLGGPSRDWIGIYEECATILYQEIDYINEGKNADMFRRNFRNVKWVRVPLVYWDYTASKVLTLEYVPGIKINRLDKLDAQGFSRSRIASRAIEAYLIQILKTGFFHADPHPGNLAIEKDEAIIYYDFGMMGEIKTFTRERLLDLFYAVYEKDSKKVVKSLIDLEALQPTGDLSAVRRSVQFFLDNLLSQTPDQQQTLSAIGEDLFAIAQDQPFRFPSTFTFVLRAFSTLEGVGYTLDPDFSFAKVAAPYAQELLDVKESRRTGGQLVQEIRKQAQDARDYTISMPYRVQRIEEFVKQLESGDLKLRVRVLESERAARKATILQMATMYTVLGGTLLNVGVTLSSQGTQAVANGLFIGAGVMLTLLARSMQRVKKLDKFEKMI